MTIFKTKHQYYLQLEDDIRSALTTTGPYFDKLMKRYTLAKTSVCIILVVLVFFLVG